MNDTSNKIRVLIADDHGMILDVLSMFLATQPDMDVTTTTDLDGALSAITENGGYDVVLLDYNMPGMNGTQGLIRAIKMNKNRPVAILTGTPTRRILDESLAKGAAGLVPKTMPAKSLAIAIRFMHVGETYVPLDLMREDTSEAGEGVGKLSAREKTVLECLGEGKQNKEIANSLQLSEATIKMHVKSICKKLGANNRTHAVITARDQGLL
ncbi:response regulator transcription factor [Thalassovita mangrovi]|uniref:Response regulator n=1 Tax=Thalassovita mangrovi TaxID=2692236 RepID=A0A6L8LFH9_9RHOB|nr:response regulator transcription factor [Thalassovita mangrovi]MYM53746.1 response regulator [Thalassovita mangrovi]